MKNTGLVVANDLKPERQKATIANLQRLGVRNTIVCNYDGRKLPGVRTFAKPNPCTVHGIGNSDALDAFSVCRR
jgi:16S rRNA C967 or C1407 C5-methylase (RsmB/RsmF family)